MVTVSGGDERVLESHGLCEYVGELKDRFQIGKLETKPSYEGGTKRKSILPFGAGVYYFNSYTGLSMWEPPEWVDELDPHSGACYYTHSKTGETQWERPFDFVPIVREELYSTPQAAFLKSILSPKRSHHRMPQTTGPR